MAVEIRTKKNEIILSCFMQNTLANRVRLFFLVEKVLLFNFSAMILETIQFCICYNLHFANKMEKPLWNLTMQTFPFLVSLLECKSERITTCFRIQIEGKPIELWCTFSILSGRMGKCHVLITFIYVLGKLFNSSFFDLWIR